MSRRRTVKLTADARREMLLAEIAAIPARRTTMADDAIKVQVDFLDTAHGIVAIAARMRRMSVAAFIRRAAYAMACHDLDIPLSDALTRDPRVARENGFPVSDPEGRIFGRWEIEKLVGEEAESDGDAES